MSDTAFIETKTGISGSCNPAEANKVELLVACWLFCQLTHGAAWILLSSFTATLSAEILQTFRFTCPLLPFCPAWVHSGWIPERAACIPAYHAAVSVWWQRNWLAH